MLKGGLCRYIIVNIFLKMKQVSKMIIIAKNESPSKWYNKNDEINLVNYSLIFQEKIEKLCFKQNIL